MKALILNSGQGTRMGELTRDKPKGMLELGGGYTLLSRQLSQLSRMGVKEAIITTGPFPQALETHARGLGLDMSLSFVPNAEYASSNYILSMHLAAPLLQGDDVLLLHGDLVLEDSVLYDLLQSPISVMAVDRSLPLPEKDFKAKLRQGHIVAVGVEFFEEGCVACQPAYRWLAPDFAAWMGSVASFVNRGDVNVYAENAFNTLDGAVPLAPLDLDGRLCHEIDNPQDMIMVARRFLANLNECPHST